VPEEAGSLSIDIDDSGLANGGSYQARMPSPVRVTRGLGISWVASGWARGWGEMAVPHSISRRTGLVGKVTRVKSRV
jgi:hypothetical protein